jgi:hypothetical protein
VNIAKYLSRPRHLSDRLYQALAAYVLNGQEWSGFRLDHREWFVPGVIWVSDVQNIEVSNWTVEPHYGYTDCE